jgi:hypothetical protein
MWVTKLVFTYWLGFGELEAGVEEADWAVGVTGEVEHDGGVLTAGEEAVPARRRPMTRTGPSRTCSSGWVITGAWTNDEQSRKIASSQVKVVTQPM